MPISYAPLFIFRMTAGAAHNGIANASGETGRTDLCLLQYFKTTAVREPRRQGPESVRLRLFSATGALLILLNML